MIEESQSGDGGGDAGEQELKGRSIKSGIEHAKSYDESGIIIELSGNREKRERWLDRNFGFMTYVWGLILTLSAALHLIGSPIIYHAGIFLMYTGAVIDIMEPNKDMMGVVKDCLGFFLAGFFLFVCIMAPGRCL